MKRIFTCLLIFTLALSLIGCKKPEEMEEAVTVTESVVAVEDINASDNEAYADLLGSYQDSVSERAMMEVMESDDGIYILVTWANSAFEYMEWIMTATLDEEGRLSYSDCECNVITSSEDGSEMTATNEYRDKEGYFVVEAGELLWEGAYEDNCKECVFVKMVSAEDDTETL